MRKVIKVVVCRFYIMGTRIHTLFFLSLLNLLFLQFIHDFFLALPVRAQRSESEHGDADRGELNHRNHLTSHCSEDPLVVEIPDRVQRHTSNQKQNISHGQAGNENVGYTSHRARGDEYFHKCDVAKQTNRYYKYIHRRNYASNDEMHRFLSIWCPVVCVVLKD